MEFTDQALVGVVEFPGGEMNLCQPKYTNLGHVNLQEMQAAQIRHSSLMEEFIRRGYDDNTELGEDYHRNKMRTIAAIHTVASILSLFAALNICYNAKEDDEECVHSIQLGSASLILTWLLCFLSNNT
jgi:hypothetical protein